jgi:hypothetical protein
LTAKAGLAYNRPKTHHEKSPSIDILQDSCGMSVGEGTGTGFATMRGRDYPTIRQFTVFLENRVGQLLEVIRRFEGSSVRIVALSISDATECAFVRFLLSHPEQGREVLERAGLAIVESDLIGLELPDGPNPLLEVCTALLQAEVNIVQAYPLMIRPHGRPAVALMVDNLEMAQETLRTKGFSMITERDLVDEE